MSDTSAKNAGSSKVEAKAFFENPFFNRSTVQRDFLLSYKSNEPHGQIWKCPSWNYIYLSRKQRSVRLSPHYDRISQTEFFRESQDCTAAHERAGTDLPCKNEEIPFLQGWSWICWTEISMLKSRTRNGLRTWRSFRLFGEKCRLLPILDLCSSDIVSYTISDRSVLVR